MQVNESVSVVLWSNHNTGKILPYSLYWRGRRYQITKVGLHHTFWQGRTLIHVFSVTDGSTYFKLLLNTETLTWSLAEIDNEINC